MGRHKSSASPYFQIGLQNSAARWQEFCGHSNYVYTFQAPNMCVLHSVPRALLVRLSPFLSLSLRQGNRTVYLPTTSWALPIRKDGVTAADFGTSHPPKKRCSISFLLDRVAFPNDSLTIRTFAIIYRFKRLVGTVR